MTRYASSLLREYDPRGLIIAMSDLDWSVRDQKIDPIVMLAELQD